MKTQTPIRILAPLLFSLTLAGQIVTGQYFAAPQTQQPEHPPSLETMLQGGRGGQWWHQPAVANRLELTPDQTKKIEDIFQQSRIKLIDLSASLDKEEAILEPLLQADQPDVPKMRTQIDRIATARAELEKANANMQLSIRLVLTTEQWHNLVAPRLGLRGGKRRPPIEAPTAPPVPVKK